MEGLCQKIGACQVLTNVLFFLNLSNSTVQSPMSEELGLQSSIYKTDGSSVD